MLCALNRACSRILANRRIAKSLRGTRGTGFDGKTHLYGRPADRKETQPVGKVRRKFWNQSRALEFRQSDRLVRRLVHT